MFIVTACIVGIIVVIVVVVIFGGMIYQKVVQSIHYCSIVDSESFSSKMACLFQKTRERETTVLLFKGLCDITRLALAIWVCCLCCSQIYTRYA